MYIVEEAEKGKITIIKKYLLGIRGQVCTVDLKNKELLIPFYSALSKKYVHVKFRDIKEFRGTAVSNTHYKGSARIGFAVKVVTSDFDYLIDLHCYGPEGAEELINLIKGQISPRIA